MPMTILVSAENPVVDQKTLKTWDLKSLEVLTPGDTHHIPFQDCPSVFAMKIGYCLGTVVEGKEGYDIGFYNASDEGDETRDYPEITPTDEESAVLDLKKALDDIREDDHHTVMYEVIMVARRMIDTEVDNLGVDLEVKTILNRLSASEIDSLRAYFQKGE